MYLDTFIPVMVIIYNGHTHFINASILNERYNYENKPLTVEWNCETNELEFI
jgi:hypothetical protein